MEKDSQNKHNRREFCTRALRYSVLGLMTALGGYILAKRHRLISEGKCINNYYCADCEFLRDCELPEAASAK